MIYIYINIKFVLILQFSDGITDPVQTERITVALGSYDALARIDNDLFSIKMISGEFSKLERKFKLFLPMLYG